ncbi:calcium-activated potassium channel subunit beta-1 [Rhinophrynus dorsalis]
MKHPGENTTGVVRMEKKLFTAQKRGETRAIYLGFGTIVCSIMIFFVFGFAVVPRYLTSFWTEKSVCTLVNASFKDDVCCTYKEATECHKTSYYPCLEVLVQLNYSQDIFMLYHTEVTPEVNNQCSYIPKCEKNYTEVKKHVVDIQKNFTNVQTFPCFYDPEGRMKTVILKREFGPEILFKYFVWPASMFTGGLWIVILVKISQYFSMVSVQYNKLNIR